LGCYEWSVEYLLVLAVVFGHMNICQFFLQENGADLNLQNGHAAIFHCEIGDLSLIKHWENGGRSFVRSFVVI
jgi:hypothetical protein